jgi:hypothetical protein
MDGWMDGWMDVWMKIVWRLRTRVNVEEREQTDDGDTCRHGLTCS